MSDEKMTLPDDKDEALRRIASYLRCLDMTRSRAVVEVERDGESCEVVTPAQPDNPRLIGYYQLTPWLKGLLDIADECDRIRQLPEPALADDLEAARAEIERLSKRLAPYEAWSCKKCGCAFNNPDLLRDINRQHPAEFCTPCYEAKILCAQRDEAAKRAEKAEAELERLRAYVYGVEADMDAVKVERNTALDRKERAERELARATERDRMVTHHEQELLRECERLRNCGFPGTLDHPKCGQYVSCGQDALREMRALRARLADLESWREQAGTDPEERVADAIYRELLMHLEPGRMPTSYDFARVALAALRIPLPEPPKEAR